ncbi:MAG: gamma-glutamyltransferase [Proteobacteria bacterium CG1_02_64_396]|nr:MAG: gamma-glutamyltransferase [Proteobacteria bacterium CG1_02_64_396]
MKFLRIFWLIVLLGLSPLHAQAAERPAAIATAHPLATEAGIQILKQGGNAFDAAVAVAATLGVVEPSGSGLGGGGFFLLHRAADGLDTLVDAREKAPGYAKTDMFSADPSASLDSAKGAAIPGIPAGLAWIAQRYGKLPLAQSLAPAIRLARAGFPVDGHYAMLAKFRESLLARDPRTAAIFLDHGRAPSKGFVLRQLDLAQTLEKIAANGRNGFYGGDTARELVNGVRSKGGIWSLRDLTEYQIKERPPIRFNYRGATIVTAPPPCAGGVVLAETLGILGALGDQGGGLAPVVEGLRRGYQDRARYLGDPDFVDMPLERLLSPEYAVERARGIDLNRATPSISLGEPLDGGGSGSNTSHFSIVDAAGNRVAATLSLNYPFGAAVVAGATGVLINDEMDDFVMAPGVPNAYGLVGGKANAIAPDKRPLSSMTPTFVEDERGVLVLGTPGGSRIITSVLLGILNYLGHPSVDLPALVAQPRYHHQYLPDRVEFEPGSMPAEVRHALAQKGYMVAEGSRPWGNMQAVWVSKDGGEAQAASDPRGEGAARVVPMPVK